VPHAQPRAAGMRLVGGVLGRLRLPVGESRHDS
jgi:hypothetical protein